MATTYETDPERLARLRAELAPHWHDDHPQGPDPGRSPFLPDPEAPCTVCLPWRREVDHYRALEATAESATGDEAAADATLTGEVVDRWLDLEGRLREHRDLLHAPLRFLPEDPRLRGAYADPVPDTADGRAVYREPPEGAGVTERSKAFFLLNRHRLGRIVAAGMRDFGRTHPDRGADGLRLYDDAGRVLALAGMTAGYGGEGPHGTLWVLRLCGFREGAGDARGSTTLERTVFGCRTFWLTRGPGPRGGRGDATPPDDARRPAAAPRGVVTDHLPPPDAGGHRRPPAGGGGGAGGGPRPGGGGRVPAAPARPRHARGYSLWDAAVAKAAVNRTRRWGAPDADGVVHHEREGG